MNQAAILALALTLHNSADIQQAVYTAWHAAKGEWIVIDSCPSSGKGSLLQRRGALAVALSWVWLTCSKLSYGAKLTQGAIALVGGVARKGTTLELTPCGRYFRWPSRWRGGVPDHKKILLSRK